MIDSPDTHEIDALEQLLCSDGWRLVAARIREEIERKRDALESGPLGMNGQGGGMEYHRGFLAACRMLHNLPGTLTTEIQQQLGGR